MEINAGLTIDNKFVIYGKDDENPLFSVDLSNTEMEKLFRITDEDRVKIGKAALHTFVEIVKSKTEVQLETTQTELLDETLPPQE
jgi:hypothetical protein